MRRVTAGLALTIWAILMFGGRLPELWPQAIDWSSPAPRREMEDFRKFLSSHPWIANKLRGDPALANSQDFLRENPELPQFLNAHPFIQSSFKTDASGTLSRAQLGDWSAGSPANYAEMQAFQQFLLNHPWISGKLRQNPSLANDADFLNGNRELPQFLNGHPYIQSSLKADAKGFMLQMQNFSSSPSIPTQGNQNSWQNTGNRGEMMEFQYFLNSRPGLAAALQDDPSLANNQNFLSQHYDLVDFLNAHPDVQHALQSDATGFMRRMGRLSESSFTASQGSWNAPGNQLQMQETQDWVRFMNEHPWIANKLRQNPSLATSRDFLNGNRPLAQFLDAHPYVQSQFRADPNGFMGRAQAYAAGQTQSAFDPHAPDYESLNLFMQNHKWIANQLKEKPSRATSADFLNENRELRDFLQAHPYLQEQFRQDARATLNRALQSAGGY